MFAPKTALTPKQIEDRMKATRVAKKSHQIFKWTRLIQDALNWRIGDLSATEVETEMRGCKLEMASHEAV
jgi:hypothetical protein